MSVRIDYDHERLAEFCRKWQITELALFGSVLRDDFGPDSDVDVLVSFAPESQVSYWDWPDLEAELRDLFHRPIHLVAKGGLRNPFRRRAILDSMEVIHAR
jgi:predicted nucleotidyltransferase